LKHSVKNSIKLCGLSLLTVLASCAPGGNLPIAPPSTQVEQAAEAPLEAQATTAVPGLTGEYFDNIDFTGVKKTRIDSSINSNWGAGAPIAGIQPTTYSVRWTGQIKSRSDELYTFYLASAGAIKLILNGQVILQRLSEHDLVNDKVDVKLKPNTTYDLAIEYSYGSKIKGTAKLEWSGTSFTKQVAAQSNLLSVSSDKLTTLNMLKSSTYGQNFNNADTNLFNTTKINNRFVSFLRLSSQKAGILAATTENTVNYIYKYEVDNKNEVYVSDLKSGRKKNLGSISQFVGVSGEQTIEGDKRLVNAMALFISNGRLIVKPSSNLMQAQTLLTDYCASIIAPPPACDNCSDQAVAYQAVVCNTAATLISFGITGGISGLAKVAGTTLIGRFIISPPGQFGLNAAAEWFGGGISDVPDLFSDNLETAWQRYLDCISSKIGTIRGCPPIQKSTDAISDVKLVNESGIAVVDIAKAVSSKGVSGALTGVADFSFDPLPTPGFATPTLFPHLEYILTRDGDLMTIIYRYTCPSTPQALTANVKLTTNSENEPSKNIPITINCKPIPPKISDPTPNPLNIIAKVGEIATGTFSFQNTVLNSLLNFSLSTSAGLTVSGTPASPLAGGTTEMVTVGALCEVAGTKPYTVTITSDDPLKPSVVETVNVTCTDFPDVIEIGVLYRDEIRGSTEVCFFDPATLIYKYIWKWSNTGHTELRYPISIISPKSVILESTGYDCSNPETPVDANEHNGKYSKWLIASTKYIYGQFIANKPVGFDPDLYQLDYDCSWGHPDPNFCLIYPGPVGVYLRKK
jgi:PA14 domain